MYEPLLKSNASKTVTAQIFAEILKQNGNGLKGTLLKDDYLKYIIDAINYACGEDDDDF